MLKRISLQNFRNHRDFSIDLENTNLLIGKNGIGKTNVLEAVAMISYGRSFRQEDKKNLVNYNSRFARVRADNLEIFIQNNPRLLVRAKERGIARKMSQFIGILPSVIFSPETIYIITGAPAERRRFLDIMISQIDKDYLKSLLKYTKVRRQRNHLLQQIGRGEAGKEQLDFWDKQLVDEAEIINKKRVNSIKFLEQIINQNYHRIANKNSQELELIYHQKSGHDLGLKLLQNRDREIAYGGTIYGPHRDDLEFRLGSRDMSNFASRGELRSAILALKIAELIFIKEKLKERRNFDPPYTQPVLLLDDVFSEFDQERRAHLSKLILIYQTIITVTNKDYISDELQKESKIIELK